MHYTRLSIYEKRMDIQHSCVIRTAFSILATTGRQDENWSQQRTVSLHGTTKPSEIVCEMHVAQLLKSLSSLSAEHTNFSVVGKPFYKPVAPSADAEQQQTPGSFETNFEGLSIYWYGREVLSTPHLFPVSF
jgi:hypothetical protein